MSYYEFQGSLYRNSHEMHMACASQCLSAGGANGREFMLSELAKTSDEKLALDCWKGWGLAEDERSEWSLELLTECFAEIRSNFDKHFPSDA